MRPLALEFAQTQSWQGRQVILDFIHSRGLVASLDKHGPLGGEKIN